MKKYITLFIVLIKLCESGFAEKKTDLSLEKTIELGLKNNIDIKINKSLLNEKRLIVNTSFNKFFPTSNFTSTLTKSRELSKDDSKDVNTLSMNFDLSLSLNAKLIFDVYQNILDFQEGKVFYEIARKDTISRIKKIYFSFISASEKLKLKEIEMNNAKDKFNNAQKSYSRGEGSELDKLNTELSYKKLIPELFRMQNAYNNQLDVFKVLIGLPENENIILIDKIPDYSNINLEKLSSAGIINNLQIKQTRLLIQKDINSQNINIALLTPTFKIGYSLNNSFLNDPYVDEWFADISKDWKTTGAFSMSLTLPLDSALPFSQKQTDLIKSIMKIGRDRLKLDNEILNAKINLKYRVNEIKELMQTQSTLKFNIEIAERAYKLTEKEYYNAQKTYLELKDSEKSLLDAKINYLNSQYDLYTNIIDIENISNQNLADFF